MKIISTPIAQDLKDLDAVVDLVFARLYTERGTGPVAIRASDLPGNVSDDDVLESCELLAKTNLIKGWIPSPHATSVAGIAEITKVGRTMARESHGNTTLGKAAGNFSWWDYIGERLLIVFILFGLVFAITALILGINANFLLPSVLWTSVATIVILPIITVFVAPAVNCVFSASAIAIALAIVAFRNMLETAKICTTSECSPMDLLTIQTVGSFAVVVGLFSANFLLFNSRDIFIKDNWKVSLAMWLSLLPALCVLLFGLAIIGGTGYFSEGVFVGKSASRTELFNFNWALGSIVAIGGARMFYKSIPILSDTKGELSINLRNSARSYSPGDEITGTIEFEAEHTVKLKNFEVSLICQLEVVRTVPIEIDIKQISLPIWFTKDRRLKKLWSETQIITADLVLPKGKTAIESFSLKLPNRSNFHRHWKGPGLPPSEVLESSESISWIVSVTTSIGLVRYPNAETTVMVLS